MSDRFEDTPELFGEGLGTSTYGDIKCNICGKLYNKGEDERGVYGVESEGGESVTHTTFAELTVCYCCFAKIENEVLRRMGSILSWYRRILDKQAERLRESNEKLEKVENKARSEKTLFDHLNND
jgi:hypothetical protein